MVCVGILWATALLCYAFLRPAQACKLKYSKNKTFVLFEVLLKFELLMFNNFLLRLRLSDVHQALVVAEMKDQMQFPGSSLDSILSPQIN